MPRAKPTFWEVAVHEARAFGLRLSGLHHHPRHWRGVGQAASPQKIRVWIGLGRDQAQILKQMIEDSFTPETGIYVDLELITFMDQLLVPRPLLATSPDVAIGAANMDMAFRGAVADLTPVPRFPRGGSAV